MHCTQCDSVLPADAAFCGSCGAPIAVAPDLPEAAAPRERRVRGQLAAGTLGCLALLAVGALGFTWNRDGVPPWKRHAPPPEAWSQYQGNAGHQGLGGRPATRHRQKWVSTVASSWPVAIGGNGLVYVTQDVDEGTTVVSALDSRTGRTRWTYAEPEHFDGFGAPAVGADGSVIVCASTTDGKAGDPDAQMIVSLDGWTGKRRWAANDPGTDTSAMGQIYTVIGSDGTIYGAAAQYLRGTNGDYWGSQVAAYALDPRTGKSRWVTYLAGNENGFTPHLVVSPNRRVYVVTTDEHGYGEPKTASLHALDGANGNELWRKSIGEAEPASLSLSPSGTLFVRTTTGIVSMSAVQGDGFRTLPLPWSMIWMMLPPALAPSGGIVTRLDAQKFGMMDPKSGKEVWSRDIKGYTLTPSVAGDGTVYITSNEYPNERHTEHPDRGVLYALRGNTGETLWTEAAEKTSFGAVSIAPNGTLYVSGDKVRAYQ